MYTKGEWKVVSAEFTGKGVAFEVIMPKQEICKADANLIEAAPDLYEALRALYNSDPEMSAALQVQVQEALAKAKQ
ncbi:hypothetical protein LCGC14_0396510 [marine sediment metagenome]|uniref:Uncharacterized protein n=1 Tax=marine sediment metagenome TaxID=412755 RepID=A0A0F9T3X0_9ZZZZ